MDSTTTCRMSGSGRALNVIPEGGAGVTWQEELRKLDEDFSSGNLTADEYRARRDQVLSSAVAPGDQQAQQWQPAPDPLPQGEGNSGGDPNADSTQVIEPVSPPHGSPAQAGPGPHGGPDSESERTQALSPWQQQPPPWNAPHEDVSPPWGGSEFPPIAPSTESDWVRQGPETFDDRSARGRTVGLVIVAVLLAGLGVAAFFFFTVGDDPGSMTGPRPEPTVAGPTTPSLPEPPSAKAAPKSNEAALIKPPGKTRDGGGKLDLDILEKSELLPAPVAQALARASMKDGLLATTSQGSSTIGLYALRVKNETDAGTVARAYATVQQEGGLPSNEALSLRGVPVFSTPSNSQDAVFRAVYVLYDRVIIIETFGPGRDSVQRLFEQLMAEQVDHAPPTTRKP